jgi:hypothetical protein
MKVVIGFFSILFLVVMLSSPALSTTPTQMLRIYNGTNLSNNITVNGVQNYNRFINLSLDNPVNAIMIPSSDSINVTVTTWKTTGNYYKKWNESSYNHSVTTRHTIGDFPANAIIQIKKNGRNWNIYTSNASGYVNFTYYEGYSSIQFEAQRVALLLIQPNFNTTNRGEPITYNIKVEPAGVNISDIQADIVYNPTIMNVTSVTEGNLFSQNGSSTIFSSGTIDNNTGIVTNIFTVIVTPRTWVNTTGIFATFTVYPKIAGNSSINLSNVIISDPNSNSVPNTIINGSLTVNNICSCPPNLLVNSGFESGTTQPLNWNMVTVSGNTPIWDIVSHTGARSIKISIPGTTNSQSGYPQSDLITAVPLQNYTFSAWVKTSGAGGASSPAVRIVELDSNKSWIRQTALYFNRGTNDWANQQATFQTAINTKYLYVYSNIWSGYGTFWVDDVGLSVTT